MSEKATTNEMAQATPQERAELVDDGGLSRLRSRIEYAKHGADTDPVIAGYEKSAKQKKDEAIAKARGQETWTHVGQLREDTSRNKLHIAAEALDTAYTELGVERPEMPDQDAREKTRAESESDVVSVVTETPSGVNIIEEWRTGRLEDQPGYNPQNEGVMLEANGVVPSQVSGEFRTVRFVPSTEVQTTVQEAA